MKNALCSEFQLYISRSADRLSKLLGLAATLLYNETIVFIVVTSTTIHKLKMFGKILLVITSAEILI